jgi:hypothetical protein
MTFKEWYYNLQEVGFSTSCIANFSLPIGAGGPFTRKWPPSIEDSYYQSPEDEKKLNKRKDK